MAYPRGQFRAQRNYECSECDFKVRKYKAPYVEHMKVVHGIEL